MIATNILWDTEGEFVDLPSEIKIPDNIKDDEDLISDYLSDVTGFCHLGFMLEEEE